MSFIEIKSQRDLARIRRIALDKQGLLKTQPFGLGLEGARKVIQHLGYVQIDTISVVERAHHHIICSRVPNFEPSMTNQLLRNKDVFEYWTHAAAFIPIKHFRFSLPYKRAIKSGQTHWQKNPDKKLMKELLARIRTEGPIRSRDLESTVTKRTGWWDLKPAKKALEQLYMEGDLMVSDRTGFQKTYDLTERMLPLDIDTSVPNIEEFAEHLVNQQLRCHGLVSLKGFTYLRKVTGLRDAVKTLVNERLSEGTLQQINLGEKAQFFIRAGDFEKPIPKLTNRLLILSPFDNCVIQRDRLKTLFDFDYQIECYVPEAKRKYGYFALPLLYRGEFVGRMDCKVHRKERRLEIKALHIDLRDRDGDALSKELTKAIKKFANFLKCDFISLRYVNSEKIKQDLSVALS